MMDDGRKIKVKSRHTRGDVNGFVHSFDRFAEIFIGGMGTAGRQNDAPIYIECHEGEWRLIVWADINSHDPTHIIDMSGAFESNREEDE